MGGMSLANNPLLDFSDLPLFDQIRPEHVAPAIDQLLADAAQRAPLRRLVSIDDVGALSTFMASDASRSMTGSTLYVDAGFHILG